MSVAVLCHRKYSGCHSFMDELIVWKLLLLILLQLLLLLLLLL